MKVVIKLHDMMQILLGNGRWKETAAKYGLDYKKLKNIEEKLRKGEFKIF